MPNSQPDPDSKRKHQELTLKEAKLRIASFCAYQERYHQEVREKLYTYGLRSQEVEELLSFLITEGFLNEERFAKSFAGGRFRLKKWGRLKIENELKRRRISPYCIGKGLEEIDNDDYLKTILQLIDKKAMSLKITDTFKLKKKIANYLIRKGFENELVWNVLNRKFRG